MEKTTNYQVEVRPLPLTKWHGKKEKDNFSQAKKIEVLYDPKTGGYATGLTDEEEKELSEKLKLDLSRTFNPEKPHPYWSSKSAVITLPNHTIFFNPNNPLDYIKIKNLKASKYVANSLKEWEEGKYEHATHYIHDEQAEVEVKSNKVQNLLKCASIMEKMTLEDKVNVIQVVLGESVRNQSISFVDAKLQEIIDSPSKQKEFLQVTSLSKSDVYTRALVGEAVHKNIINKKSGSFYYMDELIGENIEEAIRFFNDDKNQRIKVIITEKLNK